MARIYDVHPLPHAPNFKAHPLCVYFYMPKQAYQVIETDLQSHNGDTNPTNQKRIHSTLRSDKISLIISRSLQDLEKNYGYSKEKTAELKQLDDSLDPRRSMYIQLTNEETPAMLRIFDGSTLISKNSTPWKEGSLGDHRLPLERENPNLLLAERQREKFDSSFKAHILELGLLNVDRELRQGIELLFSHVTHEIDRHYNQYQFRANKSIEVLEKLDLMIYAQTKKKKVPIFEKYGFKSVLQANSHGEIKPYELNDDYVLMYFKASDFVKQYYSHKKFVNKRKQADDFDQKKEDNYYKVYSEQLTRLNKIRIKLDTFEDMQREAFKIFQKYALARSQAGETLPRKDLLIDFFEEYYVFIQSIPKEKRHKNWSQIHMLLLECFERGNPFDALYILALSLDKSFGVGHLSNSYSQGDFDQFINTPYRHFKLIFPSEPSMVFSFDQ